MSRILEARGRLAAAEQGMGEALAGRGDVGNAAEELMVAGELLAGELEAERLRAEYAVLLRLAERDGWARGAFTARVLAVMAERHVAVTGRACCGHAVAVLEGRL